MQTLALVKAKEHCTSYRKQDACYLQWSGHSLESQFLHSNILTEICVLMRWILNTLFNNWNIIDHKRILLQASSYYVKSEAHCPDWYKNRTALTWKLWIEWRWWEELSLGRWQHRMAWYPEYRSSLSTLALHTCIAQTMTHLALLIVTSLQYIVKSTPTELTSC